MQLEHNGRQKHSSWTHYDDAFAYAEIVRARQTIPLEYEVIQLSNGLYAVECYSIITGHFWGLL